MIARIVSFALSQRFLVVVASLAVMIWGVLAFLNLPSTPIPTSRRRT